MNEEAKRSLRGRVRTETRELAVRHAVEIVKLRPNPWALAQLYALKPERGVL